MGACSFKAEDREDIGRLRHFRDEAAGLSRGVARRWRNDITAYASEYANRARRKENRGGRSQRTRSQTGQARVICELLCGRIWPKHAAHGVLDRSFVLPFISTAWPHSQYPLRRSKHASKFLKAPVFLRISLSTFRRSYDPSETTLQARRQCLLEQPATLSKVETPLQVIRTWPVRMLYRQGSHPARLPGVQQARHQDNGGYSPECSQCIHTIGTPFHPDIPSGPIAHSFRGAPSTGDGPSWRALHRDCSLFAASQGGFPGMRADPRGGEVEGADLEKGVLRRGEGGRC